MNSIHIFTVVKRQSFSGLAKEIERTEQDDDRKPIVLQGGLWGNGATSISAYARTICAWYVSLDISIKNVPQIGAMGTYHREHVPDIAISGTYYSVITISVVLFIGSTEWLRNKSKSLLFT